MATFPVKYINNAMRGAPQLSGTAGTLIAVLDAFLITGFGQVTALSVTVAGGIATASLQAGQSFDPYCVVLVEGATPAALNGEARVLTSSSTSITFATTAPDGVATGAITIKVAPVGKWEKPFTGTNKAVYRSTDIQGSRFCLWVDDSGTITARVRGFESMTDVNTGTGPFPIDVMVAGGGYVHKSITVNAQPVRYAMAADSRAVLWAIEPGTPGSSVPKNSNVRGFGDAIALAPAGDAWAGFLSCITVTNSGSMEYGSLSGVSSNISWGCLVMPRAVSSLGGAVLHNAVPFTGSATAISGADATLGAAPSNVDGKIYLSKLCIRAATGTEGPRAIVPGVAFVPQTVLAALIAPHDQMAGAGDWAGRTLLAISTGSNASSLPSGIAFIDLTGPWR